MPLQSELTSDNQHQRRRRANSVYRMLWYESDNMKYGSIYMPTYIYGTHLLYLNIKMWKAALFSTQSENLFLLHPSCLSVCLQVKHNDLIQAMNHPTAGRISVPGIEMHTHTHTHRYDVVCRSLPATLYLHIFLTTGIIVFTFTNKSPFGKVKLLP